MATLNRRSFIAATIAALAAPSIVQGAVISGSKTGLDRVWLQRLGVGEEINIKLQHDSIDDARNALREISWFFRDWKDEDAAYWMDPDLPHVLAQIQTLVGERWGRERVIQVTSGYRTPRRNDSLRKQGAVHNSLHTKGKAGDILIPGVSPSTVGKIAAETSCGGIGVYPKSGFTHVDTGRRRYW